MTTSSRSTLARTAPIGLAFRCSRAIPGLQETSGWPTPRLPLTVGAAGTFVGTAPRNPFYGLGINYADMAIEKNIYFTEARHLQLRLESFDTFNHANFANSATPGFSAGGEDASEPAVFGQIFSVNPISTNAMVESYSWE